MKKDDFNKSLNERINGISKVVKRIESGEIKATKKQLEYQRGFLEACKVVQADFNYKPMAQKTNKLNKPTTPRNSNVKKKAAPQKKNAISKNKPVTKKINEIRYNKKTKHFSWVFGKDGHMRKSAGLTHQPESKIDGKVVHNIKLPKNPNPKEGKTPSYFNPMMQKQHKRSYSRVNKIKKDGWKMPKENKEKVLKQFKKKKR